MAIEFWHGFCTMHEYSTTELGGDAMFPLLVFYNTELDSVSGASFLKLSKDKLLVLLIYQYISFHVWTK